MKASEIRELSLDELKAREKELRESLFNLKIQHKTGQLANTSELTRVRRDIARITTIAREKHSQA